MKGICRECGASYLGRADKLYCCDGCRNAYHNRHNRSASRVQRTVHSRLRRNYRILNGLKETDAPGRIGRHQLAEQGFDFRYLTHLRSNPLGTTDYYVYDLGYRPDKEGWVRLLGGSGHFP